MIPAFWVKTDKCLTKNRWRWSAGSVIFLFFTFILVTNLSNYWGFISSLNDLGVYDQIVWALLSGESFLNTTQLNLPINWLGFHFHTVLALFMPLYAICAHVVWFAIAHALASSIAALVIFYLARHIFKSECIGFLWLSAFLLNPTFLNVGAYDFMPIVFVVPCIAINMLAIELKKSRLLIFSCLFILLCKEHLGLMVMGFGVLWQIKTRLWKISLFLILLGSTHAVIILSVVMPYFSPTNAHIMFSDDLGRLSRYSWLGKSLTDVLQTLIMHPVFIAKTVLAEMGGVKYLGLLLVFFLGFPLAAPAFIIPGIPDLMVNMLSDNPLPRSIFAYHNATLIPILAVASMHGVKKILRCSKIINRFSAYQLSFFILLANLAGGYFLAPLPLPGARNIMAPIHFINRPDPYVKKIRSLIGDDASVSAQSNIGVHFSQRKEIYLYPNKIGEADFIILRLQSPTKNINNIPTGLIKERKHLAYSLDGHLQMDRISYLASVEYLMASSKYNVMLWHDPWLVFEKKLSGNGFHTEIRNKLHHLKQAWQVRETSAIE